SMGLHFPRERWDDLQRGLAEAARELGFDNVATCVGSFLSERTTKTQLQVLASHLTIGETYFFRDKPTLDALAGHILPELIRARAGREQRLRIWSAGCCTGEESYSLAILLHQLLPDLSHWHVTITATDINGRYLQKAAAGTYGEWSFRNAPADLKERYFKRSAEGRYTVLPEIRQLVSFEHLNLVEDVYPTLATDTNAMDLIFCRNVLMYFTPFQIRKVIRNLRHALIDGGWLAVSPSEASQALFSEFRAVNFPGAIVYQKSATEPQGSSMPGQLSDSVQIVAPDNTLPASRPPAVRHALLAEPAAAPENPTFFQTPPASFAVAESLYQEGRYAQAAEMLLTALADGALESPAFSLLTRALANQGRLAEALVWCDRWIAVDKRDAAAHYLRAIVLLEQGDAGEARSSLQRAIYLDPEFVLAHFALGNLARSRGKIDEAHKYFTHAQRLLRRHQPNDLLPESDGLTAGRLAETLASMTSAENAP
ncbi:MAG: chemotaxis protein methyltransferase CheR, partial [Betaproteobacteria bacterium]